MIGRKLGRPAYEGDWLLILIVFLVQKGAANVSLWLRELDPSVWYRCNFKTIPQRTCFREHVKQFEQYAIEAISIVGITMLVRRSVRVSGGLVGRDVVFDATPAFTRGALLHICPKGHCPRLDGKKKTKPKLPPHGFISENGELWAATSVGDDPGPSERELLRERAFRQSRAVRPSRQEVVDAEHERRSKLPDGDAVDDIGLPHDLEALDDAEELEALLRSGYTPAKDGNERRFRQASTGCLYALRDRDAGLRALEGRYWWGFYLVRFIDVATGLPLVQRIVPASVQEHLPYEEMLEELIAILGRIPRSIVADAALANHWAGAINDRWGIEHVVHAKGRRDRNQWRADPHGRWDENGIPICKHCAGTTRFARRRLEGEPGEPGTRSRIYFGCRIGMKPQCASTQSLYVGEDPRVLTAVWRTSEVWHALFAARGNREGLHATSRRTTNQGPDSAYTRPGRKGSPVQQLLATLDTLVRWFMHHALLGWVDGVPRIAGTLKAYSGLDGLHDVQRRRWIAGRHVADEENLRRRAAHDEERRLSLRRRRADGT